MYLTLTAMSNPAAFCGPAATGCVHVSYGDPNDAPWQEFYGAVHPASTYRLEIDSPLNDRTISKPVSPGSTYVALLGGIEANSTQVDRARSTFLTNAGGRVLPWGSGYFVDVNGDGTFQSPPDLFFGANNSGITRELLRLAARTYLHRQNEITAELGLLTRTRADRRYATVIASAQTSGTYIDGAPFAVVPDGLLIDIYGVTMKPYRIVPNDLEHHLEVQIFGDHALSSLEHEVWQSLTGFDAISTMRGIQKALGFAEDGSLIKVRSSADLPNLYTQTGFTTGVDSNHFNHEVVDVGSPINARMHLWTSTGQPVQFDLVKERVDADLVADQENSLRGVAAIYYSGPFDVQISASDASVINTSPVGTYPVTDLTWPDFVKCIKGHLFQYRNANGAQSVPATNPSDPTTYYCLTWQFQGNVAQLRLSLKRQWDVINLVYSNFRPPDIAGEKPASLRQ